MMDMKKLGAMCMTCHRKQSPYCIFRSKAIIRMMDMKKMGAMCMRYHKQSLYCIFRSEAIIRMIGIKKIGGNVYDVPKTKHILHISQQGNHTHDWYEKTGGNMYEVPKTRPILSAASQNSSQKKQDVSPPLPNVPTTHNFSGASDAKLPAFEARTTVDSDAITPNNGQSNCASKSEVHKHYHGVVSGGKLASDRVVSTVSDQAYAQASESRHGLPVIQVNVDPESATASRYDTNKGGSSDRNVTYINSDVRYQPGQCTHGDNRGGRYLGKRSLEAMIDAGTVLGASSATSDCRIPTHKSFNDPQHTLQRSHQHISSLSVPGMRGKTLDSDKPIKETKANTRRHSQYDVSRAGFSSLFTLGKNVMGATRALLQPRH